MSKLSLQSKITVYTLFGMGLMFAGGVMITSSDSSVATFGMATFVGVGIGILILTVSLKSEEETKNKLSDIESKLDKICDKLDLN